VLNALQRLGPGRLINNYETRLLDSDRLEAGDYTFVLDAVQGTVAISSLDLQSNLGFSAE
jgi:hypothetical protein